MRIGAFGLVAVQLRSSLATPQRVALPVTFRGDLSVGRDRVEPPSFCSFFVSGLLA